MKRLSILIFLATVVVGSVAWVSTPYWRVSDLVVEDTLEMQGAVTISDAITLTGAITQTGDFTQYGDFTTTGTTTVVAVDASGNIDTDGNLYVTGDAETTGSLDVAGKTTLDGEFNIDSADDTITSAATEVDVAGKNRIVVTTDAATTGVTLTNGEADQEVMLIGTSDSNTVQVDDGANYDIGGNKALGANDVLTLYTLDGTTWFATAYLDN